MSKRVYNGNKRNDRDFYPTPVEFCSAALELQPWIVGYSERVRPLRILDAGAGTGNWGSALRRLGVKIHLVGVDLPAVPPCPGYDEWHSDYFEVWISQYTGEPFDLVIGNPPYKADMPEKWLRLIWHRALTEAGRVFWLLRLNWFSSQGRYARLFSNGYMPAAVYQSARRISFTGDGKVDDTDYAMFLWVRNWGDKPCSLEMFDWKPDKQGDQMPMFYSGVAK